MAKLTKMNLFKTQSPRAETKMDKTSRIVREMVEKQTEERQSKINRLRKARLEQEANSLTKSSQ